MQMIVHLGENSYPITIEKGAIHHIQDTIDTHRKIAIIADDKVPDQWINIVADQCENAFVLRFPAGEGSKCFTQFEALLEQLADQEMTSQ